MPDIDSFSRVIMRMGAYDALRSGRDHNRTTSLVSVEGPYGSSVRIKIVHKLPNGELKSVGAQYIMSPISKDLADQVLNGLEEGHEMLDQWAFPLAERFIEEGSDEKSAC